LVNNCFPDPVVPATFGVDTFSQVFGPELVNIRKNVVKPLDNVAKGGG
jgi:hypothetical protein